jgi:hypothetical protein
MLNFARYFLAVRVQPVFFAGMGDENSYSQNNYAKF